MMTSLTFKKIVAVMLCLLFVLSLTACGKEGAGSGNNSSIASDNDPTQDYDDDTWINGSSITESAKEELEDLWGEIKDNTSGEIVGSNGTSSSGTTTNSSSSEQSSSTGSTSSTDNTASSGNSSEAESSQAQAILTDKVDAIF